MALETATVKASMMPACFPSLTFGTASMRLTRKVYHRRWAQSEVPRVGGEHRLTVILGAVIIVSRRRGTFPVRFSMSDPTL